MPFASTTIRNRRRAEVRRRDGDGPCALQLTADCQALGGQIDYDARPPHPRSYEVDHVVSSEEAARYGWSPIDADALDNLQLSCRQCNRSKSSGVARSTSIRPSYINPRFK
ncbi:HNH endonuclease [Mycobacterium sp. ENV421]|uniref:HNH endonuclease signature motif containing protein n=1 Tax=Mycobacterium sp. ENV421 TaxID=1213407 RepID=UPI000C9AB93C|nr:HNH endonuclease [Mycobacterium sp. ENV421]